MADWHFSARPGREGGVMGSAEESRHLEDCIENYGMLSRLFRLEADADLLNDLVDSPCVDETGNVEFDEGYGKMRSFLDSISDIACAKSDLAIDYSLVFLGYGVDPDSAGAAGAHAAYPYESFFRTGSQALGGEHCSEVSSEYRSHAFMPTKTRIIAEDHIACELEFLQYLASLELEAVREGDNEAALKSRRDSLEFLQSHLLSWIDDFRKEVEKHADASFYPGLCEMTKGWLEIDEKALQDSLSGKGGSDD